jgi:hypothetical protein
MTDLSKKLRDRLKEEAEIVLPELQSRHDSKDGTVKWLFATDCGQAVETVFIPELCSSPNREEAHCVFLPRLAARLTALFARRERKASIAT